MCPQITRIFVLQEVLQEGQVPRILIMDELGWRFETLVRLSEVILSGGQW